MALPQIRLVTANLPDHRILEAIFLEESRAGLIEVSSYDLPNSALAGAELNLLQYPDRAVALVLNAGTDVSEKVDRKRAGFRRYLARITRKNWIVVLAVPDVDSWVADDPRVRERMTTDPAFRDSLDERAVRIEELASAHPLDRSAIGQAHPEFRTLLDFIEKHTSAHASTRPQK